MNGVFQYVKRDRKLLNEKILKVDFQVHILWKLYNLGIDFNI